MATSTFLFPAKIHQLRKEKQLYQKQIADALSIDTQMYIRIEQGGRRARREQIPTVAKVLQANAEVLLSHFGLPIKRIPSCGMRKMLTKF